MTHLAFGVMADIGSTLREARMRERIDISEVEAQTKIRAKYLRAIENEEWDLLPGPIYAKSFLRTYSDYLGLDSRMLLDEFKRRYERPSEHDRRPTGRVAVRERGRERDHRPNRFRAPSWAPVAIVVVVVAVILYIVGSFPGSSTNTTSAQKPPPVHSARTRHQNHPRRAPVAPSSVTLHLVPTNTVYVCLVNGNGTKLINEQTFNVGQTIPTATAHKLLLTLGNAAVQMKVDGKSVPVAPSATAIRMLITPASTGAAIQHIPDSLAPTCP